MDKHFYVETDNLRWAVLISSAFKNLIDQGKDVKLTILTNRADIQYIANAWFPAAQNMKQIVIPGNDELDKLDKIHQEKHSREMYAIHGVLASEEFNTHYPIYQLTSTLIALNTNYTPKEEFWIPSLNKSEIKELNITDYVIGNSNFVSSAQNWMKGYGVEGKVTVLNELPTVEKIKALLSPTLKLVALDLDDELLYVVRARYKGYDSIKEQPCALTRLPLDYESNRYTLSGWGGMAIYQDESQTEFIGRSRRIQEECGFDHHTFHKKRAKGEL